MAGSEGRDGTVAAGRIDSLTADDTGLLVHGRGDFALDVCFDDARVLSFWLERDTQARDGGRFFAWPAQLRKHLDGAVTVSLRSPVDGTVWTSVDAVLGSGEGRVAVVDAQGHPLAMDKSMKLQRLFGDRDAAAMAPLLDALEEVLGALEKAGVRPFVAYGTLLGAVRDGDVIGHDSDADIGYVSDFEHPVDVVRESFLLQRRLLRMGYRVQRYSGLGLKVIVREADGGSRGLDVFGGFCRDGHLYLMGEVGTPFDPAWLHPRTTASLAGREVPVPAVPERLLEAMYGPSWKVPDPAFKFTTPQSTVRRLDGWFRGMRVGLDARWQASRAGSETVPTGESTFVHRALERDPDAAAYLDLGCGRGLDAVWLAERTAGRAVVEGLDYFPPDLRHGRRAARERGVEATFSWLNLRELRSVMEAAARLSRIAGPRVVLAHHVLDATDQPGRENLLRLARVLARGEGRLHLQVQVAATARSRAAGLRTLVPADVEALVAAAGGTIEHRERLSEADAGLVDSHGTAPAAPSILRMVVSWPR